MSVAKIRKTAYMNRQVLPNFRSNLNLLSVNAMYSSSSVESNDIAEYSKPCEFMPTQCFPGEIGKNDAFISHGKPKHNKMSNVFEPIELLIPIDPWPCQKEKNDNNNFYTVSLCTVTRTRASKCAYEFAQQIFDRVWLYYYLPCLATMTEETASGTLVPAAKNVIPITESGMFNVLPIELRKFYANDKNKLNLNEFNINWLGVTLLSNWCSDAVFKIKKNSPHFPRNKPIRLHFVHCSTTYQQWWSSKRRNTTVIQSKQCTWEMWVEINF